MKLYQLLPVGAVGQISKAAKVQSAQDRVRRLAEEVAARKEHWHVTLLKSIDEFYNAGNYVKVLQLIRFYTATYPNSPLADEVEKIRTGAVQNLKPAKRLSRQGLPFVEKIPAAWGR